MKVSIIIRALNEEKHLGKLFRGLAAQTYRNFEVIFVDSGSNDNSVAIAQENNAKIINIPKEQFSFGRSLNLGCKAASGEILVFISAHVYPVSRKWLSNMVTPFDDKDVSIVYGRQIGNEFTKFSEHQIFNKWFPEKSNYDQEDYFTNNANCATRKSIWLSNPYDEQLTGLEDLYFSKNVKSEGGRIVYSADAEIVHIHEETFMQTKNRYMREAIAMKYIEPSYSFSFSSFIKNYLLSVKEDLSLALTQNKFTKHFLSIVTFRFAQKYGTYQGFNKTEEINDSLYDKFYRYDGKNKALKSSVKTSKDLIDYEKE